MSKNNFMMLFFHLNATALAPAIFVGVGALCYITLLKIRDISTPALTGRSFEWEEQ
jgi:hypothetical protein